VIELSSHSNSLWVRAKGVGEAVVVELGEVCALGGLLALTIGMVSVSQSSSVVCAEVVVELLAGVLVVVISFLTTVLAAKLIGATLDTGSAEHNGSAAILAWYSDNFFA
jgi:hypothetical protein